jgi:hypothetical protein
MRRAWHAAAVLAVLAGCAPRPEVVVSPEERLLLDHLTRDRFVVIERLDRDEDDRLVIRTQQGVQVRRYRIQPDIALGGRLRIHRLVDDALLPVDSGPRQTLPRPG